jgi:hypothetical protein
MRAWLLAAAVFLAACGAPSDSPAPTGGPTPTPTVAPVPTVALPSAVPAVPAGASVEVVTLEWAAADAGATAVVVATVRNTGPVAVELSAPGSVFALQAGDWSSEGERFLGAAPICLAPGQQGLLIARIAVPRAPTGAAVRSVAFTAPRYACVAFTAAAALAGGEARGTVSAATELGAGRSVAVVAITRTAAGALLDAATDLFPSTGGPVPFALPLAAPSGAVLTVTAGLRP